VLPRLYELKDATDESHPVAYFRDFESRFVEGPDGRIVLGHYQRIERQLSALDDAAWSDLKARAARVAHKRDGGRGWRALFDTLDESKGYAYLLSIGCTDITFIKTGDKKTPDLGASLDGNRVLCEVKTINVSQDEAERRELIAKGPVPANITCQTTTEMLAKVSATLAHAVAQLDAEDPQRLAHRIVFTVLNFDDWVGHYQVQYIAQLDAHLQANPVAGTGLVFCPARNLFEHRFTMQSATVVEI
jgi:hypothetical protein